MLFEVLEKKKLWRSTEGRLSMEGWKVLKRSYIDRSSRGLPEDFYKLMASSKPVWSILLKKATKEDILCVDEFYRSLGPTKDFLNNQQVFITFWSPQDFWWIFRIFHGLFATLRSYRHPWFFKALKNFIGSL